MTDLKIKNIRENAISDLVGSGISHNEAVNEAEILIKHIFEIDKKALIINPDKEVSAESLNQFNDLISKRIKKQTPVQYLINSAYFYGNNFFVDENVLIPRPETEILVEEAINIIKENSNVQKIIDIGTGSGCIACSIAYNVENIKVIACDISEIALEVAQKNYSKIKPKSPVKFVKSNLLENIDEKVDFIVSNPPYIPENLKNTLQAEVLKHEPHLALFAQDEKGLDNYRKIIIQSQEKLNKGGFIAFEAGINQAQDIKNMLKDWNFEWIKIIKDFSNIDRVVIARKKVF